MNNHESEHQHAPKLNRHTRRAQAAQQKKMIRKIQKIISKRSAQLQKSGEVPGLSTPTDLDSVEDTTVTNHIVPQNPDTVPDSVTGSE